MQEHRLRTHYETGEGLAVTVQIQKQRAVVFKLRLAECSVAQIMEGEITNSPLDDIEEYQCRTQITFKADCAKDVIGNHYLAVKYSQEGMERLRQILKIYGIFVQ